MPYSNSIGAFNIDGNDIGVFGFENINTAPSFSSSPVTTGQTLKLYTYNITVTDAQSPLNVAITAGSPALPSWLTLNDNGDGTATLSGTPTLSDVGTFPIALIATDGGGLTATQNFNITVTLFDPTSTFFNERFTAQLPGSVILQTGLTNTSQNVVPPSASFDVPGGTANSSQIVQVE